MDAVLPQTQNEALVFKPGMSMTLLVALVFATAALLPLALLKCEFSQFFTSNIEGRDCRNGHRFWASRYG